MLPLRYAYFWLSVGIALLVTVLVLAVAPTGRISAVMFLNDKTAHFCAFLLLMLWFCGVYRLRLTPWVALGLLCFGLLIEYLQSLVPYRFAEWADAAYDLGGILAGWFLAILGVRHWATFLEARLFKQKS